MTVQTFFVSGFTNVQWILVRWKQGSSTAQSIVFRWKWDYKPLQNLKLLNLDDELLLCFFCSLRSNDYNNT